MRHILTAILLTATMLGQSAPAPIPHRVEDWRVLPEPQPHHHMSRRTKIILTFAGIGAVAGIVGAHITNQHCGLKTYDGLPYSGVNVPCPKESK